MIVDDLLARLTGVQGASPRWSGCCPAHEDATPSLSIGIGEGERIVLFCHAGCTVEAICEALGLEVRDLFSSAPGNGAPPRGRPPPRPRKVYPTWEECIRASERIKDAVYVRHWIYSAAAGSEVMRVIRFRKPDGKKDFFPAHQVDGGWVLGDPPGKLPLYRLPELATRTEVFILEGERCADTAWALGFPATTSAHGSQSANRSDWTPLAGRRIVIIPDHDWAGEEYALDVVKLLHALDPSAEVKIIRLPDLEDGEDIVEFLEKRRAAGNGDANVRQEIDALVAATDPEERAAQAEAARSGGEKGGNAPPSLLVGIDGLGKNPGSVDLERAMRAWRESVIPFDPIRRQVARGAAIDFLKSIGVSGSAAIVDAALAGLGGGKDAESGGTIIAFEDPEPWADPVDGAELLDEIEAELRRFMVLPEKSYRAVAFWIVHTHAIDAADISPRLDIKSPEMQCGKTRLLSIIAALCRKPLAAANVTASTVFRAMEAFGPTLLVDEADSFLKENEELRGILNSGHSRATAQVPRCVGEGHEVRLFSTWGAVAIAAIGDALPGTLADRSIEIAMKRKGQGEKVERLRRRKISAWADPIRRKAWRWAQDNIEALKRAEPEIPPGLSDRDADNWEPLLAIADLAGGPWPERAREVAVLLSGGREADARVGAGTLLLGDIRGVFYTGPSGILLDEPITEHLRTEDLLRHLNAMDERPWPGWRKDKGLSSRNLATLLKPFGIASRNIKLSDGSVFKGYPRDGFKDAWGRYIPVQSATPLPSHENRHLLDFQSATGDPEVADRFSQKPHENGPGSGVADKNPPEGGGGRPEAPEGGKTAREAMAATGGETRARGSVKILITRADEARLRDLGYSQSEINAMLPKDAGEILATGRRPREPGEEESEEGEWSR